jgi:hypothetical protein
MLCLLFFWIPSFVIKLCICNFKIWARRPGPARPLQTLSPLTLRRGSGRAPRRPTASPPPSCALQLTPSRHNPQPPPPFTRDAAIAVPVPDPNPPSSRSRSIWPLVFEVWACFHPATSLSPTDLLLAAHTRRRHSAWIRPPLWICESVLRSSLPAYNFHWGNLVVYSGGC